MQFSLQLPGETLFGPGRLAELPTVLARFPAPVALVHGGASYIGVRDRLLALLEDIPLIDLPPQVGEPTPADVDAATTRAREDGARCVVAIGGGSVLDLGKAVAALVAQHEPHPVQDYLEDVGEGRTLHAQPLPFIAIPTTAGTGSEASKNAVITSLAAGFKKSLRHPGMMAQVALIDPELTLNLPPELTAWSGLDAVTQLIEAYTSLRAQPVTDALALRGLAAARSLPIAFDDGRDLAAREQMALAAYLSGVCLANAGLGATHGIAAGLGSMTDIPHGLACAIALPWVMAYNLPVMAEKYAVISGVLTGERDPLTAITAVWAMLNQLHIPRATEIPGVGEALGDERLPRLAQLCQGNSLRGNPREVSEAELIDMLRAMRDLSSPLEFLAML